jgi:hypothetical protein
MARGAGEAMSARPVQTGCSVLLMPIMRRGRAFGKACCCPRHESRCLRQKRLCLRQGVRQVYKVAPIAHPFCKLWRGWRGHERRAPKRGQRAGPNMRHPRMKSGIFLHGKRAPARSGKPGCAAAVALAAVRRGDGGRGAVSLNAGARAITALRFAADTHTDRRTCGDSGTGNPIDDGHAHGISVSARLGDPCPPEHGMMITIVFDCGKGVIQFARQRCAGPFTASPLRL